MDLFTDEWLHVGRTLLALGAFLAFSWSLLRMRREAAAQALEAHQAAERAHQELKQLSERVSALATLVASLPRAPVAVSPPAPVERERERFAPRREFSGVRSYETARRLARSGATVEEIVATCGVAGTEARLLRRLHGNPESDRSSAA